MSEGVCFFFFSCSHLVFLERKASPFWGLGSPRPRGRPAPGGGRTGLPAGRALWWGPSSPVLQWRSSAPRLGRGLPFPRSREDFVSVGFLLNRVRVSGIRFTIILFFFYFFFFFLHTPDLLKTTPTLRRPIPTGKYGPLLPAAGAEGGRSRGGGSCLCRGVTAPSGAGPGHPGGGRRSGCGLETSASPRYEALRYNCVAEIFTE